MPTFSAVARPSSNDSTYVQTINDVNALTHLSNYYKVMEPQIPLGQTSNNYQWWSYTAMVSSTHSVGSSIWPFPLNDPRNASATKSYHWWGASYDNPYSPPENYSTVYGHSSYNLEFFITGWEDLPEYISPKGIECIAVATDTYSNGGGPYYWPSFSVQITKPNGQGAQKLIRRPDTAYIWQEQTTGGATDIWFTTSVGLSASEVRGAMKAKLVGRGPSGPGGPSNPSQTWAFIDELKFVLYFQTDWYYGIVGTVKGMQNKMNGVSLSTVAGVNGMSREA